MPDYKKPEYKEPAKNTPKNMKILFVAIPVAIVALAAIFIVFGFLRGTPPIAMPPQQVILGEVTAKDVNTSMEYVAQMEADNSVDLLARVSGFLISKNFSDGDLVKRDQILFQIEPDQYQALVDTAEAKVISTQAQLDRATLDFNRISDLYRKKTSPKSDYDSSKATYEVAKAEVMSAQASLTEAKLNLGYASIKAPFDGRISDTPFSEGSLLGPDSGVLAKVVSLDPILVTFGVSDKSITSVKGTDISNQESADDWQVRLRLSNGAIYSHIGKISYISPLVNPMTDTVKFKAKFENPDKILVPNQIVTAIVEKVHPARRLLVPKEAVLTDTDGNFVYLPKQSDDGQQMVTEMRRVTLDGELDKDYIIKEGLSEGEKFILKGLMSGGATLTPGAAIQISEPQAAEGQLPQGEQPKAEDGGNK
ncbi:hypothetical protein C4J81_18115 [Deltaproteobacteria bacterium Smac51]|nr:hypothetical protein C4J81_18115 [Deltaproteobacteria bacterium Smac51]